MAKRLTRNDIAKRAGVSPSTVSRALAGRTDLLPMETITQVRDIAEELGYTKNILASRLASNKSFQLGFAVPLNQYRGLFQVSYYATILDAMVSAALPSGYTVSITPIENDQNILDYLQDLIRGRQVDGFVIGGLKQDDPLPAALEAQKIPAVLVGSHYAGNYVGSVNCDPLPAIESLVSELENRHYTRLFFVTGDLAYYDAQVQLQALQSVVATSSFSELHTVEGNYSRRSGYAAAESLAPQLKAGDCVFLGNDRMATGFYRYCYEHDIVIPDQVGVVGSDDDEAATVLYPDLTTIRQPRKDMGETAVNLLINTIEENDRGPAAVILEKTLCLRKSLTQGRKL